MKLTFDKFRGMAPKYDPVQIPANMASVAVNVRLDRGGVKPLKDFVLEAGITQVPGAKSIYYYEAFDTWLVKTEYANYAPYVLPNDPYKRLFFTDETYPKVRADGDEYRLGIPSPTILNANVTVPGDLTDPLLVETPAYVATYVDAFGSEGPPSDPVPTSGNIGPGFTVVVSLDSVPVGDYNLGVGSLVRLYRTATGSSDAEYLYVGEVPIASLTLTDTVETSALQEPLPSATWIGPPDDDVATWPDGPLQGMIDIGNGVLAGFSGNTLHFSEPYIPHGWPLEYRIPGPDPIVGIVAVARGVLVLTSGRPWLAMGTSPASMVRVAIETNHSCVSRLSIVDMGSFAVWASPDGLVASDGGEPRVLTTQVLDKDSFAVYQPTTIRAAYHEGMYVMACDGDKRGAIFTMSGQNADMDMVEFTADQAIVNFAYSLETDELYCLMADGTTYQFDAGADMPGQWRSAIFVMQNQPFSALRVETNRYPVPFTASVSSTLLGFTYGNTYDHDGNVLNNGAYRLPHGMRARYWQFDFTVNHHIHSIEITDNVRELT